MAVQPLLVKFLLIGDSGVGKTSILQRFSDDAFSTSHILTIGIDFKMRTIELEGGRKVNLQVWDTAGQERFHSLTESFYRGASGVMLVYDITSAESFEHVSGWLSRIEKHASESVVKMILGNKCDLPGKRVVSRQSGEEIATMHNTRFLETSAKANFNIDNAFYELAETVMHNLPQVITIPNHVAMPPISSSIAYSCCY